MIEVHKKTCRYKIYFIHQSHKQQTNKHVEDLPPKSINDHQQNERKRKHNIQSAKWLRFY